MITLEKVKHEIAEMKEKGCMTSECIRDLTMLYFLEEKMEDWHESHKEHDHGKKLDRETAAAWVEHMQNEDGSVGAHFSMAQTNGMMDNRGWHYDPIEFWTAANAMWSDGVKTAKKYGVDTVEYWTDRARDFLCDKDARPDKISKYYEYIVRK